MAELAPTPFPDLLRRMRREVETTGAIFDLPVRKWWIPDGDLDFSALHFSRRASTPVGPAAGPHTQLAQNIVLAWLAGGRIIELKTVQVNDRLEIPRPCIHVPNIGYNVEWSQELRVHESLMEYAKAAYLIEILKATRAFGVFPTGFGFDTVFDISVGYDLDGIRSASVTGFIEALKNPAPVFDELRRQLTGDVTEFRDIELPKSISDCVTLSTFHGCPADQIESITRYLLEDLGLHTIIKLNPTLLGFDRVREILVDRLGYTHLNLRREAFDVDLQYDDGLEIVRRLREVAERLGSIVGAKFTNTLVVENEPSIFPTQSDPYMYVSGPPLHVISMNLMQRFREDLGFEFPVSFSAGIDVKNFPAAVACGMVPVTTCTDLLRQGGFGRLSGYLRALGREMERVGVKSREAYVLLSKGHAVEAVERTLAAFPGAAALTEGERPGAGLDEVRDVARRTPADLPAVLRDAATGARLDPDALMLHATRVAGRLNGRDIVPGLVEDTRYHAASNAKTPRRIDSVLELYDCINCDLCIQACPNDAIFAYEAEPAEVDTEALSVSGLDALERAPGRGFVVREVHQLAVLEEACNECSNCEVYCPEHGSPFQVKETVFLRRDHFDESALDGFHRTGDVLHARLEGRRFRLDVDVVGDRATLTTEDVALDLSWGELEVLKAWRPEDRQEESRLPRGRPVKRGPDERTAPPIPSFDTRLLWRMKTVWNSIYGSPTPNPVSPGAPAAPTSGPHGFSGSSPPADPRPRPPT